MSNYLYGEHYKDISIKVDVDYAMNIKFELMQDSRLIIFQGTTRSASFSTHDGKYEAERIYICPASGEHEYSHIGSGTTVNETLLNRIRETAKIRQVRDPDYNISFNLAAFDTVLGALERWPNARIESAIMDALLPCAKEAPFMFYDKLIHRLPPEMQVDYLFRMDEFIPQKDNNGEENI